MRTSSSLLGLALTLAACSSPPVEIDLMPAPAVYADAGLDPFTDPAPQATLPDFELLYATLRDPAGEDDSERFYANRRGNLLRVGLAEVAAGDEEFTWDQARRVSLAKNRVGGYPLRVEAARELGVLASSIFSPEKVRAQEPQVRARFAREVHERIGDGRGRDAYVYVHGYKVVYENPVLVASELWHFLGYHGAMIAFSWPSTPSRLAYFADVETGALSARGLRRLLEILSRDTRVERIHVLGYSAGTRVVVEALGQLALIEKEAGDVPPSERVRVGQVVLVGSDVDRHIMGAYLDDGLLDVVDRLTLYASDEDSALGIARWSMRGRQRAGELWSGGSMTPEVAEYLRTVPNLSVIDIRDAEDFDAGNGHAYFRRSPWVSSDVLLTLRHGLGPAERGLVRAEGAALWTFPPDYVERLESVLAELVPGYASTP